MGHGATVKRVGTVRLRQHAGRQAGGSECGNYIGYKFLLAHDLAPVLTVEIRATIAFNSRDTVAGDPTTTRL